MNLEKREKKKNWVTVVLTRFRRSIELQAGWQSHHILVACADPATGTSLRPRSDIPKPIGIEGE
jgi:hypothetical protein